MENKVIVKGYSAPEVNKSEILRYLGAAEGDITPLVDSCLCEAEDKLIYRLCYAEFPVCIEGENIDLGFTTVSSHSLAVCLAECDTIALMCATVGVGIDRLIKRYSSVTPSRSVVLQAIGSERVEALCDLFCDELRAEMASLGKTIRPRFSPGYGDLPLDVQRAVFGALSPEKYIGVSLGADLFMTPTKSVTAIIGIKNVK